LQYFFPKASTKGVQATGKAYALQPLKENIRYFKTKNFLPLGVIFAHMDPDPDPAEEINADPCESGSTTLIKVLSLKGTVSQDFLLQVFFINHLPPSP
jgi:hypothetical protein